MFPGLDSGGGSILSRAAGICTGIQFFAGSGVGAAAFGDSKGLPTFIAVQEGNWRVMRALRRWPHSGELGLLTAAASGLACFLVDFAPLLQGSLIINAILPYFSNKRINLDPVIAM